MQSSKLNDSNEDVDMAVENGVTKMEDSHDDTMQSPKEEEVIKRPKKRKAFELDSDSEPDMVKGVKLENKYFKTMSHT